MKLEYSDLKDRRITVEWCAHPFGHLVFRHAESGRKIARAPGYILSRQQAENELRTIHLDPSAAAVWVQPPPNAFCAPVEPQEAQS